VIFRATPSPDGVVLAGTEDDLEELIEYVAAEANHEHDRRRQRRLDEAFDLLQDVLDQARTSRSPTGPTGSSMQRGEPTIFQLAAAERRSGAGRRRVDRHRRAVERDVERSRSRAWLARSAGVSVIRIRSARHGFPTEQEDPT